MVDFANKPIQLGVMIGSESDLPQCEEGIRLICEAEEQGKVLLVAMIVNSIHRNTEDVLRHLKEFQDVDGIERWVVAAGMANHLTGTCDAYERYGLQSNVPVFGAIFDCKDNPEINRQAAILSITQVPGTQVIFNPCKPSFTEACRKAIEPGVVEIFPRQPKPVRIFRSSEEVLMAIEAMRQ